MSHSDRYGLALSTTSDTAAAAYRKGVDLLLSAWPGADAAFDRALAADPNFALAHAARARIDFTYAQSEKAIARIMTARRLASINATSREISHIETLAFGMQGQSAKSLAAALAHVDQWPRDALILSLPLGAFGLFAFSGMANHDQARVALCERHAGHYGDDWWFLTSRGWSHTENGNVAFGRDLTERALNQRRANANAAHALAHAMFEDGSTAAADAFIADWLPSYERRGILFGHIYWHQALAALEHDDAERALAIYSDQLQPDVSAAVPLNIMTDCTSLLWRLRLSGHEVPADLWNDIATFAERTFPQSGVTFADTHMALVTGATSNFASLDSRIAALDQRLADGKLSAGAVVPMICRATRAFAAGDHATCVRLLEPIAADVVRIGGSHAQREVFEDMLLVALIKSGANKRALSILDRRLHHRTSIRDNKWRTEAMRNQLPST